MRCLRKIVAALLTLCLLFQITSLPMKNGIAHAEGLVVYQEGKIEETHSEESFILPEYINQRYITEHMICEDGLYEIKISETLMVQAYTIQLTVAVDTKTSLANLLPPQIDDYEINWPAVIGKFAVGTAIIVVVGIVQFVTKGTSSYFLMATPGKVLKDALIGGAIDAALQVSINEISQGGISSEAATKYAIEGFADGFMWGAIGSVLHVASKNVKRLKAFKLATGGMLKIKLDGTVLDAAGNIVGKAVYGKKQWYLIDAAGKAARFFDKAGKEILDVVKMELPANSVLSLGAQGALKVCYTDSAGQIYRIGDELSANITYRISDAVYKTDGMGRIIEVSFEKLSLKSQGRARFPIADTMTAIGKGDAFADDQRGHLIADMFDGNNTLANMVPMSPGANQGTVKEIETIWQQALLDGKTVNGAITIHYQSASYRPIDFTYSYDVGDGLVEQLLAN